jgi:signal peptidase I
VSRKGQRPRTGRGSGSSGAAAKDPKKPGAAPEKPQENALVEWVRAGAWAVVLFLIIRTFILQTFVIISGSMENTLMLGDFLVVNRAAIGSQIPFTDWRVPGYSSPHQGEVLVFDPPHEPDLKLVKRLIGMPGDTLEMRNTVLHRNGAAVQEPYTIRSGFPDQHDSSMDWQLAYLLPGTAVADYHPTRDTWGPIVLPEDRYFMLGDHRDNSLDSRYWGLIEGWRFEGRVSFIYYSYDSEWQRPFGFLRNVRPGRIFDRVR